jgi:hypothetical protein
MLQKTGLNPSSDQWAHEVTTFLTTGLSQPFFTGSCCEFLVISNKASSDHRVASTPRNSVSKTSSAAQGVSYDGYLHYPEYHLLVESNFQCIDILALGEQHVLDPRVLHGLVCPEDALEYQQAGVVATGSGLRCLDSFEKTLILSNPKNAGEQETFLVKVVIVARTGVTPDKGGHPTAPDIATAGIISSSAIESRLDATIILGAPSNDNACYYLLLARLHSMEIKLPHKVSVCLYNHLQTKLKRGGFEGRRLGGSGGKVAVNSNLLKFLHHPGNFPRIGKGVKFVANGNVWKCYYVSPYKKAVTVVTIDYSQPQPGGSMSMTKADISAFPC